MQCVVKKLLTLDNGTLADLCAGVLVGVAISVNAMHVVTKLKLNSKLSYRMKKYLKGSNKSEA